LDLDDFVVDGKDKLSFELKAFCSCQYSLARDASELDDKSGKELLKSND
jgi:hypothetical protein